MLKPTRKPHTATTLGAAASTLGISVAALRRIRDLGADGFTSNGRVNCGKVLAWIDENPDSIDDDAPDYGLERALKTRVERKRAELALDVERGRLIDVQTAKRTYVTEAIKLKARLLPIGRRLCQRLAMEADPIKVEEAINSEVLAALQEVADAQ
jgi:hypothetical protein